MESIISNKLYCCNPFNLKGHSCVKKNLRNVQPWMAKKIKTLTIKHKVCSNCRKKISETSVSASSDAESDEQIESEMHPHSGSEDSVIVDVATSSLNSSLHNLGESPIKKKRLCEKKYPKNKLEKITSVLKNKVLCVESDSKPSLDAESEIVNQLKEKFSSTDIMSERIQILTVLPKSWSIKKIEREFNASNFMVRKAKNLVKEKGILATPNPKPGKIISGNAAKLVQQLYNSDEVSRCMPGKKDFISVKVNGKRVHMQKRLILSNLKEVYRLFKSKFPNEKIGFSKFCELRPPNCILAGASGTHCVCVCTIHQNVKLMLVGCRATELSSQDELPINSYKDCIARIICNPPLPICYFGECDNCPGILQLQDYFNDLFESNGVDEITYKQWISTDRSTLDTLTHTTDEFLVSFFEKLKVLLRHSFIANEQSAFQNELKSKLKEGEYFIICDFAENYSFVLQDEAQGFHWNNAQATIHPFVAYYTNSDSNTLEHTSYVMISECLHHDTVAVHLFQRYLISYLTIKFQNKPKHIFYASDGSSAQYKNRKNFTNLCFHETDFGVSAEWHFSATSHGKGACDGVGGTVKRLAARASLQRPYNSQIMTPRQLYEWASENIQACDFGYVTIRQHETEEHLLKSRFEVARTISGTQKLHCFVPITTNTIQTKIYSNSNSCKVEKITSDNGEMALSDISGFVTCLYGEHWWVGCVMNIDEGTEEVKISFLHPHGPSPSYTYPVKADLLILPKQDIILKVDVRTATGRTYTVSTETTEIMKKMFKK